MPATQSAESTNAAATPAAPPKAEQVAVVFYRGGKAWKAGLPPQKQDLGDHFQYVGKNFQEGKLVANGLLSDGRGMYVIYGDDAAAKDFIAHDPAVAKEVLALDQQNSWMVMMDGLGKENLASTFVLDYGPGPRWQSGKTMMEQAGIQEHMKYAMGQFSKGNIVAGGPVDSSHGRYIANAADRAAVDSMISADPATQSGVFQVQVKDWSLFNHQSVEACKEKRSH